MLADADAKKVPLVRKKRVRVDREGVCVRDGERRSGTGKTA